MPEKGWKTVQIKDEYAAKLLALYEKQKHELLDRGIRSFNGYMQEVAKQWLELDEQIQEIWVKQGDELRKRGIYSLPALLEEATRLLLEGKATVIEKKTAVIAKTVK